MISLNRDTDDRCKIIANYIISTGATVRQAAKEFEISKSTVHKDITARLKKIDGKLYNSVNKILLKNKNERHIRGGNSTRLKYLTQPVIKERERF